MRGPKNHRHRRRVAVRVDVAAPETFPCVFPLRRGRARACAAGHARCLPRPLRLRSPAWAGRQAGRSLAQLLGSVIFPHFAPRGFNRRFDLADLASIVSARTGLTASASIASIALALPALTGISFSSAAGVGAVGAASRFRRGSEPIIVGDGAPVIINIGADPSPGAPRRRVCGGCVIHKLIYDSDGKYVGERQSPKC